MRTVPPDQSFLFFEDIGKYTGRLVANLADFCENMKTIDIKSLTFRFRHGDYERWIRETLHDAELARKLKRMKKSNSGEKLRNKILQVVRKRLDELRKCCVRNRVRMDVLKENSKLKIVLAKIHARKDF